MKHYLFCAVCKRRITKNNKIELINGNYFCSLKCKEKYLKQIEADDNDLSDYADIVSRL